jgi:putative sterol carrier protein
MSLEKVTNELRSKIGRDCGLNAKLKLDLGSAGVVMLDATQVPNVISNDDQDADCTLVISLDNCMRMMHGRLSSTAAFMSGKLKVKGDMGIAMKLPPLLR